MKLFSWNYLCPREKRMAVNFIIHHKFQIKIVGFSVTFRDCEPLALLNVVEDFSSNKQKKSIF